MVSYHLFTFTCSWIWPFDLGCFFSDGWWPGNIGFPRGRQHILLERDNNRKQRYCVWRNWVQTLTLFLQWLSFQASKDQVPDYLLPPQCWSLWQYLLGHSSGKVYTCVLCATQNQRNLICFHIILLGRINGHLLMMWGRYYYRFRAFWEVTYFA